MKNKSSIFLTLTTIATSAVLILNSSTIEAKINENTSKSDLVENRNNLIAQNVKQNSSPPFDIQYSNYFADRISEVSFDEKRKEIVLIISCGDNSYCGILVQNQGVEFLDSDGIVLKQLVPFVEGSGDRYRVTIEIPRSIYSKVTVVRYGSGS